jgi:membrane-bound lytic murein transglycosylase MltF
MSKSSCPVMWTSVHQEQIHHWKKMLVITNFILISICILLYVGWVRETNKRIDVNSLQAQLRNYIVKNEILLVLRTKGNTLSQGLDIADALMVQCREKDIPVELGLAVMRRESSFDTVAMSNRGAKGLMQLLQKTFDNYNHNLKLGLRPSDIWDPIVNIKISMLHLSDLIAELKPKSKSQDELWKKVLVAYSGGEPGYPEAVRKTQREYEIRFRDGEI